MVLGFTTAARETCMEPDQVKGVLFDSFDILLSMTGLIEPPMSGLMEPVRSRGMCLE